MRISDWSSDVCSSDLGSRIDGFRCALPILRTLRACEHRRMTDDRIIAADATREDEAIEASIRPKRLDEYLRQQPVREPLSIYIEAAQSRSETLEPVLLFGDRKSIMAGKSEATLGDLGGRRVIKK